MKDTPKQVHSWSKIWPIMKIDQTVPGRGKGLSISLTTTAISTLVTSLNHSTCRTCQQPQEHMDWSLVGNKESGSQSRVPESPLTHKGKSRSFLLLSFEDIIMQQEIIKLLLQPLAFFLPSKIFYLKVSISQITKISKPHQNGIGTVPLPSNHTHQREVSLLKWQHWLKDTLLGLVEWDSQIKCVNYIIKL